MLLILVIASPNAGFCGLRDDQRKIALTWKRVVSEYSGLVREMISKQAFRELVDAEIAYLTILRSEKPAQGIRAAVSTLERASFSWNELFRVDFVSRVIDFRNRLVAIYPHSSSDNNYSRPEVPMPFLDGVIDIPFTGTSTGEGPFMFPDLCVLRMHVDPFIGKPESAGIKFTQWLHDMPRTITLETYLFYYTSWSEYVEGLFIVSGVSVPETLRLITSRYKAMRRGLRRVKNDEGNCGRSVRGRLLRLRPSPDSPDSPDSED